MIYHGIELTKRESEVVLFLQTGSNDFWLSYYSYEHRKKVIGRPTLTIATWFNHTIRSLQDKKLFLHIPFVYKTHKNGRQFMWANPGVSASKANLQAFTLHDAYMEAQIEKQKII